jgi:hypothetical protein
MVRFIVLTFCALFLLTSASAQDKYRKVKYAKLSKAGVKAYAPVGAKLPGIKVDGNRLYADKGYTMWVNARNWLVFAPQEVEDPAPAFSTQIEIIKWPIPGGGKLVSVCFCVGEGGGDLASDDCEFDGKFEYGDPQRMRCQGECGCKRLNGFLPDEPSDEPLVQELEY